MQQSTDRLIASAEGLPYDTATSHHQVVVLNVSGTEMHVLHSTLVSVPGSRLRRWFAHNSSRPTDMQGRYFIDRDAAIFRYIVAYLRDGSEVILPDYGTQLHQLKRDAVYFVLPGLQKIVETRIQAEESEGNEPSVIRVQVGNRQFATSMAVVLTGAPEGSVLQQIFSSIHDYSAPIFIDRNGDLFEYVLEYLRDGACMVLPLEDPLTLRRLRRETEFYKLPHMTNIIDEALSKKRACSSLEQSVKRMEQDVKRLCDCISYEYDPYNRNKCTSKLCVCMTDLQ